MCKGVLVLRLVCENCGKELCGTNKGKPCPECGSTKSEWKQVYDKSVANRRGA